jgi:hypothetical protein
MTAEERKCKQITAGYVIALNYNRRDSAVLEPHCPTADEALAIRMAWQTLTPFTIERIKSYAWARQDDPETECKSIVEMLLVHTASARHWVSLVDG